MPATWKALIAGELHEGLSLAALESLVRSRQLVASDLVCSEGEWQRVDQVPYLSRHLQPQVIALESTVPPHERRRPAEANVLRSPIAAWDALLLATTERPRMERIRAISRAIAIVGGIAVVGELLLMAVLLHGHHP